MAALNDPFLTADDSDGHRISGGKLYIFDAGTTNPATAYTTSALSPLAVHASPVVANSAGEFDPIYLDAGDYKLRLTDADGVTLQEIDNYNVPDLAGLDDINFPVVSKTADFSITSADDGKVFEVDASAAPGSLITVTADSATVGNGVPVFIANVGATGTVIIQASGSQTFDGGSSSYTLDEQNELIGIVSRGAAGWRSFTVPSPSIPTLAPQGRLTLATATPVLITDVTSATSIFYTPYLGRYVPLWDGVKFVNTPFSELTLALDSNSGHVGYHQSGKNYDLFVYSDSGTLRLGTGPAWTSDTARADAIAYAQGFLVNSATIALRYGSSSGNTSSVDASEATYVGTVRMSADGTTKFVFQPAAAAGGGNCQLLLWNMYNRCSINAASRDSTDSWDYTTATWRSANNNAANRISFLVGQAGDGLSALYQAIVGNSNGGGGIVMRCGIGLDSTSAIASGSSPGTFSSDGNNEKQSFTAFYINNAPLGFHYLQALEYSDATVTTTWYGDDGGATLLQMALTAGLRM